MKSKILLVLLTAMALSGCYEATSAQTVNRGVELCKNNDGLEMIKTSDHFVKFQCKNGARFNFDTKKGRVF